METCAVIGGIERQIVAGVGQFGFGSYAMAVTWAVLLLAQRGGGLKSEVGSVTC